MSGVVSGIGYNTQYPQNSFKQKVVTVESPLQQFRGAAYANDIGEGLKPAIGEALAKRCWYPSLLYVGASTILKTIHNQNGENDFSLGRGVKELTFQTLASLVGPILLVSLGQNTIGKMLCKTGTCIGAIRENRNPLKNVSTKSAVKGLKNTFSGTIEGIWKSIVELPQCIGNVFKMFYKDISHPIKTAKKGYEMFTKKLEHLPNSTTNICSSFKKDKIGYIFGKNGIIFGKTGLFGESGLLFGAKSSKVIGGLAAILLLYKTVDKLCEKIVNIPEKIFS